MADRLHNGLTRHEALRLERRALREGWGVPPEVKAAIAKGTAGIAGKFAQDAIATGDPEAAKIAMMAVRNLVAMDSADVARIKVAHEIDAQQAQDEPTRVVFDAPPPHVTLIDDERDHPEHHPVHPSAEHDAGGNATGAGAGGADTGGSEGSLRLGHGG